MRKRPVTAPRIPLNEPYQLSRWLNKLAQDYDDLEFGSSLEYPKAGEYADPRRPEEERLVIEIESDNDDEADNNDFESLVLTVTTYSNEPVEWSLDIERVLAPIEKHTGTSMEDAADKVVNAIWPLSAGKPAVEEPAKAQEKASIKLVQHALTNGPQTTWLSWLDITKFNSVNALTSFQVSCALVGHAVHIADVDHFLRAIDFDLNALNAPKHAIAQRVLAALKNGVKGKANIEGSAKMNDAQGVKYLTFMLELQDGTGTVFGMIDLRPQDDEEDDEVDD